MSFEQIIAESIADAPAGEVQSVIDNLSTIVGSEIDSQGPLLNYYLSTFQPVSLDKEHRVCLTKYNQSGSKFFDPATGQSFSVDIKTLQAIDIEEDDHKLSSKETEIYNELCHYVSQQFPGPDATVTVIPGDVLRIFIHNTKLNNKNFYNGLWVSEYVYEDGKLSGEIKIDVHYYEDGNVRLKASETVEEEVSLDAVVARIVEVESAYALKLNRSFTSLNEDSFKQLRRRLPVTRAKINWGKAIGNYRLGREAAGV